MDKTSIFGGRQMAERRNSGTNTASPATPATPERVRLEAGQIDQIASQLKGQLKESIDTIEEGIGKIVEEKVSKTLVEHFSLTNDENYLTEEDVKAAVEAAVEKAVKKALEKDLKEAVLQALTEARLTNISAEIRKQFATLKSDLELPSFLGATPEIANPAGASIVTDEVVEKYINLCQKSSIAKPVTKAYPIGKKYYPADKFVELTGEEPDEMLMKYFFVDKNGELGVRAEKEDYLFYMIKGLPLVGTTEPESPDTAHKKGSSKPKTTAENPADSQ
ncbi:hypothetical protein IKF81_01715 [Candidatus Saccharibacteria bacterium]|nr:hypothetical protein [Candidatus Saccharibacteria bacterium]